jgi:hypothetical protein
VEAGREIEKIAAGYNAPAIVRRSFVSPAADFGAGSAVERLGQGTGDDKRLGTPTQGNGVKQEFSAEVDFSKAQMPETGGGTSDLPLPQPADATLPGYQV